MHLCNPQLLATYAVGFRVLFCMVAAFTYINFYLAEKAFELGPAAPKIGLFARSISVSARS